MTLSESNKINSLKRWGGKHRDKGCQVTVDLVAKNALLTVPDRERRSIATEGILSAVKNYTEKNNGNTTAN